MAQLRSSCSRGGRGPAVAVCLIVALGLVACAASPEPALRSGAPRERPRAVVQRAPERARELATIRDADIAAAVQRRIANDESIPPNATAVTVDEGRVTLRGTVGHLPAARRAGEIAARTRGVRSVVVAIDVRPAHRADEAMRDDIASALAARPETAALPIDVSVTGGNVVLAGEVHSLAEGALATDVAEHVRGVRSITNALRAIPREPVADDELVRTIVDRLRRDARVDTGLVQVRAAEGLVRLDGVVGSEAERRVLEELARVEGARAVDASGVAVEWWRRNLMAREEPSQTDAQITAAVEAALAHDPRTAQADLSATVAAGRAELRGVVRSVAAERSAIAAAENIRGVVAVSDALVVHPSPAVADAEVDERITAELARDPWLTPGAVDVDVRGGTAVLTGSVTRRIEREAADEAAAAIGGVRAVEDRVAIRGGAIDDDWEIVDAIESGLEWSPYIEHMAISVSVEDGVATLRGTVDDLRAAREAEHEALAAGALDVRNELTVRPASVPPPSLPAPAQ